MAHMNQEKKALIAAALKNVMPPAWKYSLRVRHHATLVLTIASAPVDLIGKVLEANPKRWVVEDGKEVTHLSINHNWLDRMFNDPEMIDTFTKITEAMNTGNWDRSDIQSDYFDVGHYVDIQLGQWDKPFAVR